MTAYLNVFACEKDPLNDAGLRPGDHIHATLEGAVDEAEDRDYEFSLELDTDTGQPWGPRTVKVIDLYPHVREKQAERRADRQHNAGLLAGAGRKVL